VQFVDIQNEVITGTNRFRETNRVQVKRWINDRYARVWRAAPWGFRYAVPTAMAVSGGTAPTTGSLVQVTTPSDLGVPLALYDSDGDPLSRLTVKELHDNYRTVTSNADPEVWAFSGAGRGTVGLTQLFVAPKPSASTTVYVPYERVIGRIVSSTFTPGLLSADSDEPVWAEEYHYALVYGAMATGLKMENDPTWPALEDEYNAVLDAMKDELVSYSAVEQWGREVS
jgi:hypothetical protein